MSGPNYAGNIIINLASLPDFLRKPIMKKRLDEFFTMSGPEQKEIVQNALAAGPDIPFPNFARLCTTWLEAVALLDETKRLMLFGLYADRIATHPHDIVRFNMDGMLGILASLGQPAQRVIADSLRQSIEALDDSKRGILLKVMPGHARRLIGA